MGACNIEVTKIGVYRNANEAYRQACDEADEEYGHQQGYSGAINSTHGIRRAQGYPRYGTKVFYSWYEKVLDEMETGDLIYIELTKGQLKKFNAPHLKGKRNVKGYVFLGWARE